LIDLLSADLPDTQLVWSQMLPRLKWWFSDNTKAMEKAWYRVSNNVATYFLKKGGVTSVIRTLLGTVVSLEMMAYTS
jgi:hypothetical protein